ncbi:MAG: DUF5946 family protein [Anaerolineae bacterium]|nr:DUF5946 family protein [Anaerolineae bacterium]
MMESTCPECGAVLAEGQTCRDHFDQMLFWEAEDFSRGVVHHLLVLCYHLQHPSLYSMEGLQYGLGLLDQFVVQGITPADVRKQSRDQVASGNRNWKITARPDSIGAYDHPITWTMTAADVVAQGADNYVDSVRAWAQSVHESLKLVG